MPQTSAPTEPGAQQGRNRPAINLQPDCTRRGLVIQQYASHFAQWDFGPAHALTVPGAEIGSAQTVPITVPGPSTSTTTLPPTVSARLSPAGRASLKRQRAAYLQNTLTPPKTKAKPPPNRSRSTSTPSARTFPAGCSPSSAPQSRPLVPNAEPNV